MKSQTRNPAGFSYISFYSSCKNVREFHCQLVHEHQLDSSSGKQHLQPGEKWLTVGKLDGFGVLQAAFQKLDPSEVNRILCVDLNCLWLSLNFHKPRPPQWGFHLLVQYIAKRQEYDTALLGGICSTLGNKDIFQF